MDGNVTSKTLANGCLTYFAYDAANRIAGIYHCQPDGAPLAYFEYNYDAASRITSIGLSGAARYVYYTYDDADRLIGERTPHDTWTWQYDAIGNRTHEHLALEHVGQDRTEVQHATPPDIARVQADGQHVSPIVHERHGPARPRLVCRELDVAPEPTGEHVWAKARRVAWDGLARLNVLQVAMPTLRDRLEGLPALAGHFLAVANEEEGTSGDPFTAAAMEILCQAAANARRLPYYGNGSQTMGTPWGACPLDSSA